MTTSTVKLLGYDPDNDRVYIDTATGRVAVAEGIREARAYFLKYAPAVLSNREEYEAVWGKITTRKKR